MKFCCVYFVFCVMQAAACLLGSPPDHLSPDTFHLCKKAITVQWKCYQAQERSTPPLSLLAPGIYYLQKLAHYLPAETFEDAERFMAEERADKNHSRIGDNSMFRSMLVMSLRNTREGARSITYDTTWWANTQKTLEVCLAKHVPSRFIPHLLDHGEIAGQHINGWITQEQNPEGESSLTLEQRSVPLRSLMILSPTYTGFISKIFPDYGTSTFLPQRIFVHSGQTKEKPCACLKLSTQTLDHILYTGTFSVSGAQMRWTAIVASRITFYDVSADTLQQAFIKVCEHKGVPLVQTNTGARLARLPVVLPKFSGKKGRKAVHIPCDDLLALSDDLMNELGDASYTDNSIIESETASLGMDDSPSALNRTDTVPHWPPTPLKSKRREKKPPDHSQTVRPSRHPRVEANEERSNDRQINHMTPPQSAVFQGPEHLRPLSEGGTPVPSAALSCPPQDSDVAIKTKTKSRPNHVSSAITHTHNGNAEDASLETTEQTTVIPNARAMRDALNRLRKKGLAVTLEAVRGSHHQICVTLPSGEKRTTTLSQTGDYGKKTQQALGAFISSLEVSLENPKAP